VALLDRGELLEIATAEQIRSGHTLEKRFLEATRDSSSEQEAP
jgi:hypothetical protein